MNLNYYEIGNRIRSIREERRLSQMAFAEMIGISREHLGRIERSPKQPSVEVLANISLRTGYSVDYILFGCSNPYANQWQTQFKAEMTRIILDMNELLDKL